MRFGGWKRVGMVVLLCTLVGSGARAADDIQKRLVQARQLILLERWEQARALLEGVVPETDNQWLARENLLADLYRGQKNYAALESLTREALARKPHREDAARWHFLRGELYLMADHLDSAQQLLDSLWHADPADSTVLRVTRLYEQHSVADLATSTYREARVRSGDSSLFAMELALLYEARRDYASATTEYFRAIARDSTRTREVENRILQLVVTAESKDAIRNELEAARLTPQGIPARKLLITVYLADGQPDRALDAAWEVDSLNQQAGLSLIMFMRQAAERGYDAVAARTAQRILDTYPTSPVRHQAEWELALLARRTGQWADAQDQFYRMANGSPVVRFRIEAALEYADIRRLHFDDLRTADSVYRNVIRRRPPAAAYSGRALLGSADIAVRRGLDDTARAILVLLSEHDPQGAVREELTYRLAELAWFEEDLEGAQEIWSGLTVDFPRSVWVNDALRYIFMLSTFSEVARGDLVVLGRAEALARRGHSDSALTLLGGLRGSPEAPLSPRAVMLAAQIHLQSEQMDSALVLWDGYAEQYPDDADAPYALVSAARLCEDQLGQPERAVVRYRRLLEAYPRSHWAQEARGRIRSLGQF